MHRTPPLKAISAKQAVLGLYQEYEKSGYEVAPGRLVELIEMAFGAGDPWNTVIPALRMLGCLGFTQEELLRAVGELEAEGGFGKKRPNPAKVNPHEGERVETVWDIPRRWEPLTVQEKMRRIGTYFQGLKPVTVPVDRHYMILDERGGHWPALTCLKPSALAKRFCIDDPYGVGYPAMLKRLAYLVRIAYRAADPRSGFATTPLDLRDFERFEMLWSARNALRRLEAMHGFGDWMVFPGQIGARWRGSSMERVTWHAEQVDFPIAGRWREFVLPSYVVLFELLADPRRLMSETVLAVTCPGDVVIPKVHYVRCGTCLAYGAGKLQFLLGSRTSPDTIYGVATGLVPR